MQPYIQFVSEVWWKVVHRPLDLSDDESDDHDHSDDHSHDHKHSALTDSITTASKHSSLTTAKQEHNKRSHAPPPRSEQQKIEAFADSLRAMIMQSFVLLKEWVLSYYAKRKSSATGSGSGTGSGGSSASSKQIDQTELEKVLSLDLYARITGAFEMNNLSMS